MTTKPPVSKDDYDLDQRMKQMLTNTERFLIKAGADPGYWTKQIEKDDMGIYLHMNHIYGFADGRFSKLTEGYTEVFVSVEMLKMMLEYYEKNDTHTIKLCMKEAHPLLLHNGKVWGTLAERIREDEEDPYTDE